MAGDRVRDETVQETLSRLMEELIAEDQARRNTAIAGMAGRCSSHNRQEFVSPCRNEKPIRAITKEEVMAMRFAGYQFVSFHRTRRPVIAGMAVLLGTWLVLSLVSLPASVADIAWALWCGITASAIWRLNGPRAILQGHGVVDGDHLTWYAAIPLEGSLLRRQAFSPIVMWGPRVLWGLLIVLAILPTGWDASAHLRTDPGIGALLLILLWQAWLTPLYRAVFTIQTGTGRQKIYITHIESLFSSAASGA